MGFPSQTIPVVQPNERCRDDIELDRDVSRSELDIRFVMSLKRGTSMR
jgi:hypothetical protein